MGSMHEKLGILFWNACDRKEMAEYLSHSVTRKASCEDIREAMKDAVILGHRDTGISDFRLSGSLPSYSHIYPLLRVSLSPLPVLLQG